MRNPLVKLTLAVLLVAGAATVPAAAQQGAQKIGYINMQAVLRQTPGYAAAESLYTREAEGYRQEVQRLQTQLDSSASQFERDAVLLSPTARETRRKALQAQQDSLEQRFNAIRERAAARERELLDPIQQRVNTVVDGIRAEGNYSLIFDVSSAYSSIVSADRSLDLTQRVIDRLKSAGQ